MANLADTTNAIRRRPRPSSRSGSPAFAAAAL